MKRVVLTGKIWEIRHLLKMYRKKYTYVAEWVQDVYPDEQKLAKIYQFPKKNS